MKKSDFKYHLPSELIAQKPLPKRSASRLLQLNKQTGSITDARFTEFIDMLQPQDLLVFNDTKVIPARLLFQKDTGAAIELFLLNPILPSPLVSLSMEARGSSQWHVVIGNAKRWNDDKRYET